MSYKYFLFSNEQLKAKTAIEKKMGKTFKPGVVFNKGKRSSFTELSSSPKNQYSDTKIVAEGDDTLMKYTLPSAT